jgi:hypothetical protein
MIGLLGGNCLRALCYGRAEADDDLLDCIHSMNVGFGEIILSNTRKNFPLLNSS